jgi:hypothetical protein
MTFRYQNLKPGHSRHGDIAGLGNWKSVDSGETMGMSAVMPSSGHPRVPGYRFKDGRLMIFQEHEVMLIRGWEEPLAVRKSDGSWESFSPEFRVVAPYRPAEKPAAKRAAKTEAPASGQMEFGFGESDKPPPKPAQPKPMSLAVQRKKAFDAFRFSLPKEVAKVLEPFRSHQWPLLVLLARDKQVLDLASANPVLAHAVADWHACHPGSKHEFGSMPQRDLLKLLNLPDSAAVVKLFRKIPPESVDQRLWPVLLNALRQPDGSTSKFLSHVSSINLGVMQLVLTPRIRETVTPALLEEVAADAKEKYRGAVARMIGDILAMKDELSDRRPLVGVRSVETLRHLHEEVAANFQKLEKMRREQGALPPPPIPGLEGKIIPLRTQAELVAEGREQRNCVATYAAAVAEKKCYIYRVLYPDRATLCIRPQPDGNWGISEIEASCNRKAHRTVVIFVREWLEPYQIGL